MAVTTDVTAGGIRSGEPDALAGLCRRRGGAVLVYAEHVAAAGQAGQAAADAFSSFRATVATAGDRDLDAEALLLSATRHAAAARGWRTPQAEDAESDCPPDALLVGWIEETLTAAESEHFEQHVAGCAACVDAVVRFEAAERAYEDPPRAPLPASVAHLIVGALVAAAPVTALDGDATAVREQTEQQFEGEAARSREQRMPALPPNQVAGPPRRGLPPIPVPRLRPRVPAMPRPRLRVPAMARPRIRIPAMAQPRLRPGQAFSTARARGAGAAAAAAVLNPLRSLTSGRDRRLSSIRLGRGAATGVAFSVVLVLIAAVALFSGDEPSQTSGDSAASAANEPAVVPPAQPEEEPASTATPKPQSESRQAAAKRSAERSRQAAAKRSAERSRQAAAKRSAQRARERRAASQKRQAAAKAKAQREARRTRPPAPTRPSPPPAAARPTPPPPPPPPPPPAQSSPAPSGGGSNDPPGGKFSVGGET